MADDDDDLAGAIDRLATIESLGNAVSTLNTLAQAKQSSALRNEMAQLRQAEEARQRAEAERVEREYLGAHCPWCHTSLTGTPAVCAACTRDIAWLRLPLDAGVFKLISSNLHTFKEVYRDLLGASVVFDQNQKLVHVPLSSQQESGKTKETLRTLDEKLVAYINFFYRVVEQREAVIAKCPMCKSEVFASVLISSKERTAQICPACVVEAPNASVSPLIKHGYLEWIFQFFPPAWSRRWSKSFELEQQADRQRQKSQSAAAIPTGFLSFDAKKMSVLSNLLDLRTKQLEELLKRFDGAELPTLIASESSDARSEFANQLESVAIGFSPVSPEAGDASLAFLNGLDAVGTKPQTPGSKTPMNPIIQVAETRLALAREPSEFTPVGKTKPLNADSASTRAVALALVVMKTANATAARECADNLAQQLVFIEPDELLKSTRSISGDIKANTFQFVFEQVCERLRAESPNAKSKYKEIAQTIASLVPQDGKVNATNATGPKVIRALCRVLNS